MKKHWFILILCAIMTGSYTACEKDDICSGDTPTTPKMIIDFYEYLNPSVRKNIQKIEIYQEDDPDTLLIFENTDQIKLPLRTDGSISKYVFRLYYQSINTVLVNQDAFEVHYTKEDIYISRACGYKSVFVLEETTASEPNPKITDFGNDGFWIKEYNVRQPHIKDEQETHLDLLF